MITHTPLLVAPTGILDNPFQVRERYDPETLAELAESIKAHGLLQIPIARFIHADTDEPAASDDYPRLIQKYRQSPLADYRLQLAFGHRRLRACHLLHKRGDLVTMPLIVQPLTDEQMYQLCYEENERRSDLNAIERALMIEQAKTSLGWTDTQVAEHLGLDRSAVTKLRQLLKLPETVQAKVRAGDLSQRNAYALLKLFDLPEQVRANAERRGYRPMALVEMSGDLNPTRIGDDITRFAMAGSYQIELDLDTPLTPSEAHSPTCRGCTWLFMYEQDKQPTPRCAAPNSLCYYAKLRTQQQLRASRTALPPPPNAATDDYARERIQRAIQWKAENDRRDALNAHVQHELCTKLAANDLQAWRGFTKAGRSASLFECLAELLKTTLYQRFSGWSSQHRLDEAQKLHDAVVKACGIAPLPDADSTPAINPETLLTDLSTLELQVASWLGAPGRRRIVPTRADVDALVEQSSTLHRQLRALGLDDINDRFKTLREQIEQVHLTVWLAEPSVTDVTAVTSATEVAA